MITEELESLVARLAVVHEELGREIAAIRMAVSDFNVYSPDAGDEARVVAIRSSDLRDNANAAFGMLCSLLADEGHMFLSRVERFKEAEAEVLG
jgi:hypothetical protein